MPARGVLTREEAERIAIERNRVALVILDIGMPRDMDPAVRRVDGVLLYDLEGLERDVKYDPRRPSRRPPRSEKTDSRGGTSFS